MPEFLFTKTYDTGDIFFESMADAAFDSVETFFNVTGLDSNNLQDSSIVTATIAASAITETKFPNNAVGTLNIANGSVSTANFATISMDSVSDNAITAAKLDLTGSLPLNKLNRTIDIIGVSSQPNTARYVSSTSAQLLVGATTGETSFGTLNLSGNPVKITARYRYNLNGGTRDYTAEVYLTDFTGGDYYAFSIPINGLEAFLNRAVLYKNVITGIPSGEYAVRIRLTSNAAHNGSSFASFFVEDFLVEEIGA